MHNVEKNLTKIETCLDALASEYNRSLPKLIAVSKRQPDSVIDAALKAGHRIFGENRVQEAERRWSDRKEKYPDLELHLIGPLQSNKTKDAVALFDVIHTVDRFKIARRLKNHMDEIGRDISCMIQVNTGDEDQKSGVAPEAVEDFINRCREIDLPVTGLMCIPPIDDRPAFHFALMKKKADQLGLPHLSMGMSADFKEAVKHGATHLRIGSAIFGPRPKK